MAKPLTEKRRNCCINPTISSNDEHVQRDMFLFNHPSENKKLLRVANQEIKVMSKSSKVQEIAEMLGHWPIQTFWDHMASHVPHMP